MAKREPSLPKLTREEMTPPVIQPVPAGLKRPRWSVMIPTYNCARFLRETLESVLSQEIDPAEMQIEVIDDCSTTDDPEAVVREFGQGRVSFYRQTTNRGAIQNFNTCISRSRGRLINILHGDDYLDPSYYQHIGEIESLHPETSLFATRCFFINESGYIIGVSPIFGESSYSHLATNAFSRVNPIQFSSITIRRSFFEAYGGFLTVLPHTADREMWCRAVALGHGIVSNKVYGYYRRFDGNDTGRLARSADNLRDYMRLHIILQKYIDGFRKSDADKSLLTKAIAQRLKFLLDGDTQAALANEQFWRENADWADWAKRVLGHLNRKMLSLVALIKA
jgi:glycosyltransferase involved in cell wall biosynthesis